MEKKGRRPHNNDMAADAKVPANDFETGQRVYPCGSYSSIRTEA
jgi:hypothetical protein